MADVRATPSEAEALKATVSKHPRSQHTTVSTPQSASNSQQASEPASGLEQAFLAAAVAVLAMLLAVADADVQSPDGWIWLELVAAFGVGCTFNAMLASLIWVGLPSPFVLALSALLLCVPFMSPFQFGISASALALLIFIGVWKALDTLAGTRPAAVVSNGPFAFVAYMSSPVEYCTSATDAAIVAAEAGAWRKKGGVATCNFLGLALTASLRGYFALNAPALALYAEVWTIYLFLSLFCDTFSTLLALCGYRPQVTFASPLLRSTSISDFWSRRWNLLIHGLFRRTVFQPLLRRQAPSWVAGACAFAISGLFHEYSFSLAQPKLRDSLGRCALFFIAQAPIVSAEKWLAKRVAVPWPMSASSVACTVAWTIGLVPLAPLFMHPLKTSGVFEQVDQLVPRLIWSYSPAGV